MVSAAERAGSCCVVVVGLPSLYRYVCAVISVHQISGIFLLPPNEAVADAAAFVILLS